MSEDTEFREWMRAMGFNAKQVQDAADALGISVSIAGLMSRGKREVGKLERLAMAALLAEQKPWQPDMTDAIKAQRADALFRRLDSLEKTIKQMQASQDDLETLASDLRESLSFSS